MICPRCDGAKQVIADHARMADGSSRYGLAMVCSQCGGTGEIDLDACLRIEAGNRLRAARLARGMGLRSEAERRGMRPSILSLMEQGLMPPVFAPEDGGPES